MASSVVLGIQKVIRIDPGNAVAASGVIPADEEFFQDHFPGFPVLPGVLALEMLRQCAERYYELVSPGLTRSLRVKKIRQVKFRDYLKPGASWEANLELQSEIEATSTWKASLSHEGKVALQAVMVFESLRAGNKLVV